MYADDVLVFLRAEEQQGRLLKLTFNLFQRLLGLKLNLHKSELLITADGYVRAQELAAIMQCQASRFPIMHLGLPLSDNKLPRESYYPLVHREERILSGWKADMLSIGGRLILLNSVLTAQPAYYMSALILPKWVIQRLDKIRR
jgi:hypothetical protein